jgi:hypothetical protein
MKMTNFLWEKSTSRFLCTDPGAENASLKGATEPYFKPYEWFIGTWEFHGMDNALTKDQVLTITIEENVPDKSYIIRGLWDAANTNKVKEWPIVMNWERSGRVSIICPQLLGTQDVERSGVTYTDIPIYLRASRSGSASGTANSGMISETTMHVNPNRIDFENNGVYADGTGLSIYWSNVTSSYSAGRWLETMYMIKQ